MKVAVLFRPHLSFLDLDMPGLNGCEALARIRTELAEHSQVFVCLTGRSEPYDKSRCIEAGFHMFVSKPMEPEALAGLLATCRARLIEPKLAARDDDPQRH